MNTQGVNSQDSWAQFMKLTSQARARNSTAFNGKTDTNQKAGAKSTISREVKMFQSSKLPSVNLQSADKAKSGKTLGSKFDAYA
ncbi:hypothetical protein QA601_11205 [Chitinispirillales bacterium ANBcel5]|uniref:hypothetical protein n=1 Tax=Cellulosispirillum alkaliphilum TaxID=3039283 RepID=UPI002A57F9C3|nr:hypothetical protein [Chitinispirillales bacterium ANBcel5]